MKNWITTILGAFLTGFLTYLMSNEPAGTSLSWALWKPLLTAALFAGVNGAWHAYQPSSGKSSKGGTAIPPAPSANDNKSVPPPAAAILLLIVLALQNQACISSAAIVPETAANTNQINSCQSTASLHNGFVIGDFALGGGTTAVAGIAAGVSDTTAKNDLAVTGAILGGALVVGTALAAYTSSNFANSQCSSVVGPLPTVAKPTPNNTTTVTVTPEGK